MSGVPWLEGRCLREALRFSRRHRRYFVILLAIWLPSLLRWRETRVVRLAYCVAQWIDDLLDGDRPSDREPLEVVDELLESMGRRSFGDDPLSRLAAALFDELDAMGAPGDDPHGDFIALVREMRVDRERVLGRELWDAARLRTHLVRTFELSVSLMLVVSRCTTRASAVPSLVELLSWTSVVRDLEDDLAHGLVNVPREAWPEDAPTLPLSRGAISLLLASEAIRAWAAREHLVAKALLPVAEREIAAIDEERARRILGTFHRSIARFARRRRQYGTPPGC